MNICWAGRFPYLTKMFKNHMIRTFCLLVSLTFFYHASAQPTTPGKGRTLTFRLKLSDLPVPDTLGLVWLTLPYVEGETVQHFSVFSKTPGADGLYQQTITFPDS